MARSVEEIAAKMDALGVWNALEPYHWALKSQGVAFPYFCSVMKGDRPAVKVRFLFLEGWQTFHDYVRTRIDHAFGFYSSPAEMPHFELVVCTDGSAKFFRHDTGYVPQEADARSRVLGAKLLWEAYGVMLRVESDPKLPLSFSGEQAMFARIEGADGVWRDSPLAIPPPRPHVEKVAFPKELVAKAKDLPFEKEAAVAVTLQLLTNVITKEPRPRSVYELKAVDAAGGAVVCADRISIAPETGLRAVWEGMPAQLLRRLVERGRIPGEIRVASPRVFRLLRPLCLELPFKLSLHDNLEGTATG